MPENTPIERRYREVHPKSAELYEQARANSPDGVTHDVRRRLAQVGR
jgi:hypothetical protein